MKQMHSGKRRRLVRNKVISDPSLISLLLSTSKTNVTTDSETPLITLLSSCYTLYKRLLVTFRYE